MVVTYPILEDCSLSKLFIKMGCSTQEEIMGKFSNMTMSHLQVRLLLKQKKLTPSDSINHKDNNYNILLNLGGKIILHYIHPL